MVLDCDFQQFSHKTGTWSSIESIFVSFELGFELGAPTTGVIVSDLQQSP
jgi:hypothetical protein